MREVRDKNSDRLGRGIDALIRPIAPRWALQRAKYRFAYDAIDGHRTRKKRSSGGGTGDNQLTERDRQQLAEIQREMMQNNPLVKGLLKTERDGVIGSTVKVRAATADDGWNKTADAIWKEEMEEGPCDVTRRYNINQYRRMNYLAYRRDGDSFTLFTEDGLQGIEGEQVGTPHAKKSEHIQIAGGVAFDKSNNRLLGYYIGTPSEYGFIKAETYRRYKADDVHMMFDPERYSQARGEPALAASTVFIDHLSGYIEAELVAARVNACFSMFVSRKDEFADEPAGYTGGVSSSGYDEDGERLEKMEPGRIMYGDLNETATGIGQQRPGDLFDPFTLRMLGFIGRPLNIPLMLITLDFSGATFMNARIAYQKVQESWIAEQDNRVKPLERRTWRWKMAQAIARGELSAREDAFKCTVRCKRWPYVDPFKEAKADEVELANGTTNRMIICERKGDDYEEVDEQLQKENKNRATEGTEEEEKKIKEKGAKKEVES